MIPAIPPDAVPDDEGDEADACGLRLFELLFCDIDGDDVAEVVLVAVVVADGDNGALLLSLLVPLVLQTRRFNIDERTPTSTPSLPPPPLLFE